MTKLLRNFFTILFFLTIFSSFTNSADKGFQTLDNLTADENAVVLELSGPVRNHVFKVSNPPRLVIELLSTENNVKTKELAVNKGAVKRVRSGQFQNEPLKITRVVVELTKMVDYELKNDGNKVFLNLKNSDANKNSTKKKTKSLGTTSPKTTKSNSEPAKTITPVAVKVSTQTPVTSEVKTPAADKQVSKSETIKTSAKQKSPQKSNVKQVSQQTKQESPKENIKQAVKLSTEPVKAEPVKAENKNSGQSAQKDQPAVVTQTNPSIASADKPAAEQPVKPQIKPVGPASVEVVAVPKEKEKTAEAVQSPAAVKATKKKMLKKQTSIHRKQENIETTSAKTEPQRFGQQVEIPKTPVTLDFEGADIRDVLRILSVKSGINIINGEDVTGTVTLHLENVPFNKAFETILSLQGLVMQEQGQNIVRITTPLKINEERSQAVTFTKVFALNYAKAEEVRVNLDSVRTAEGRKGNISVDERTNSLVVTDTPEGLTSVERIISELDKKPQQVLIEAKIVEVVLNDSFDMGIQWQYAGTPIRSGNTTVNVGQTTIETASSGYGVATAGQTNVNVAPIDKGGTGVSFPAAPSGGQAGAIAFGIVGNNSYLTGTLTALSQKGLSKILSTPKVTTINNKEAKILVGQKVPYTTTSVSNGISTQSTQFLDVGIKLNVTPTINKDSKITLQVHPVVSLYVRADPAGPVIGTREADTTVIIQNEETIVIGGLISEQDMKLGTQVPLLGDLPVIGHLFRRDLKTKERTELLVFITPKILD